MGKGGVRVGSQAWGLGGLVVPFPETGTMGRRLCFEEIMSFPLDVQMARTDWHVDIQTWDLGHGSGLRTEIWDSVEYQW